MTHTDINKIKFEIEKIDSFYLSENDIEIFKTTILKKFVHSESFYSKFLYDNCISIIYKKIDIKKL